MDLFWSFRRKVPIIVPCTFEYFSINNYGNDKLSFNNDVYRVTYPNPQVGLSVDIVQILKIFGIPWKIGVDASVSNTSRIVVQYENYKVYRDTTKLQHVLDCKNKFLNEFKPHIIVRAKDFIEVNDAIQKHIASKSN